MPDSLDIQLQNQTDSDQVWAYITGINIPTGQRVLLRADGRSLYHPSQVGQVGTPLAEDCAIPLGPPGSTVVAHLPTQMAGGRVWFARGARLTFLLNPGPALVEPSVLNPSDPNARVDFAFAEFTLNADQLFANVSYVDFAPRLPVSLTLRTRGGAVQHVSGMPADGVGRIAAALREQARRDGRPWDKLVVQGEGEGGGGDPGAGLPLRVLNPSHGDAVGASFAGYFEPYIDEVWARYSANHSGGPRRKVRINTQAAAGVVTGYVTHHAGGELVFEGHEGEGSFAKPTTADVLGCNSGPFTTGPSPFRNSVIPRLAAAFQRSAFGTEGPGAGGDEHPSDPATFYTRDPTNHYCRVLHEVNLDGKGYAFAYDDVQPDGGADQSGKVNAGDPETFIVAVGGRGAYVGDRMPPPPGGAPETGGPGPYIGPRPGDVGPRPGDIGPRPGDIGPRPGDIGPRPSPTGPPPPPANSSGHDHGSRSRLKRISERVQKWLG